MLTATLLGYLAELSGSKEIKKFCLFAIFLFAFLYAGLRGENVGIDTAPYNQIFENIHKYGIDNMPRNSRIEEGYVLMNYILGKYIQHPQIVILFGSGIISYSFYKLIKDYSKDYALSALIFISMIFTRTLNVMRQHIGLAFVFFAISAIVNKKYWRAFFWLLLGVSMHYSIAVLFVLLIFALSKLTLNRVTVITLGILSTLVVPLYMVFVEIFVSFFPQYGRFLLLSSFTRSTEVSNQTILFLLFVLALTLIYMNPLKIVKSSDKIRVSLVTDEILGISRVDLKMYLIMFVFYIEYIVSYVMSSNMYIIHRLTYIFHPAIILLIPNTVYFLKKKYKGIKLYPLLTLFFVAYFIVSGLRIFYLDSHGLYPYQFFWQ